MKKFLFLFLALLAVPADGCLWAAIIRINTARLITVEMYSRTNNAAITGIAAASVTCRYVKDDMTSASFTPTASAGSNDWTEIGHGIYKLELTAAQLDTAGQFDIKCATSSEESVPTLYDIYPESTWQITIGGQSQTAADVRAEMDSNSTKLASINTATAAIQVKTDFLPSATAGAAGGVFIAGTNAATTVTTAFTTTFTGNLTGSVASVTGAVGSVTGAVGSVTGAVGSVTGTIGGLTAAALKDFFDTDSTTTYASAVAGSVVKEMADNAGGSALTTAAIAQEVWRRNLATDSGTAGSTAEALAAASAAGDPWNVSIPGAYAAGKAGYILGTFLPAVSASASALATAQTAITDLQARTPAALVGGRMDASIGNMQSSVLTNASIATNAFSATKFDPDASTEFAATLMSTTFEGTETFKHFLQYGAAVLFGKYNSSSGTFNFRDLADTKNRVSSVTSSTARTSVTLSPD